MTKEFFATVQNKLHFAIHGHTASELIKLHADATKEKIGLTSWKVDKVRKPDVTIVKNYLTDKNWMPFCNLMNMKSYKVLEKLKKVADELPQEQYDIFINND